MLYSNIKLVILALLFLSSLFIYQAFTKHRVSFLVSNLKLRLLIQREVYFHMKVFFPFLEIKLNWTSFIRFIFKKAL